MSNKKSRDRNKKVSNHNQEHYYYLCICIDDLTITRKEKFGYMPTNLSSLDGIWFRVGKKTYQSCKVSNTIDPSYLPDYVKSTIKTVKNLEGNRSVMVTSSRYTT